MTLSPLHVGARLGLTAAALGAGAGAAELIAGSTRWTGNKDAPVILGVTTLCLAVAIAVLAVVGDWAASPPGRFAAGVLVIIAGLVGTTTAGLVWMPAGALALASGIATMSSIPAAQRWMIAVRLRPRALLLALAAVYLTFGVVAGGARGMIGVLGAVAISAAVLLPTRDRVAAAAVLVGGAVPFAVVAHWTIVVPTSGVLAIAIGVPVLLAATDEVVSP
jgi:hypothetical protein